MANVYYKNVGDTETYYTNEPKEGYSLWKADDYSISTNSMKYVELYNDKFVFPEDAGGLFSYNQVAAYTNMDKWDTSQCTNMGSLFSYNYKIESLDLSNFDTSNVTDMRSIFYGCSKLKSLDLTNFNTSKVEDMAYLVSDCYALESIDLSGFDTSSCNMFYSMFSSCESLVKIDVSSFRLRSDSRMEMGGMFALCTNLEHIYALEDTDWYEESGHTIYAEHMFTASTKLPGYSSRKVDYTMANNNKGGYFEVKPRDTFLAFEKQSGTWEKVNILIKDEDTWHNTVIY